MAILPQSTPKIQDPMAFWPTPEAFYQERDHRTSLEVENLGAYVHCPVEIYIDPKTVSSATTQRIAILAANLMARWARCIQVITPNCQLHPLLSRKDQTMLHDRLQHDMAGADPFGKFIVTEEAPCPNQKPLRLFIGPWTGSKTYHLDKSDYIIYASGWETMARRGSDRPWPSIRPATAAAAALTAAIGVADIFKRAIGHAPANWLGCFVWNTWSNTYSKNSSPNREQDCPPITDQLDIGEVLLAGVGAIGSALIYILDTLCLRGSLTLLDHDYIEISNLNRSPLFMVDHIINQTKKIHAGVSYLSHHNIEITTLSGLWREHSLQLSQHPFDLWISLTNEDGAWAEVPFQMPPIVLHGTTTSGWGMGFGRHIPRLEDCTLCRMPRPEAKFRGPCAEGEITIEPKQTPIRASLPFLSVASAALVAAEMLKLQSPTLSNLPNAVSADFRFGLPTVISTNRRSNPACSGCRALLLPTWKNFGGRTRYHFHSNN